MKVTFIKALAFSTLFLLLFACSKQEDAFTEVYGTVYQAGTSHSKVVPNALVEFQWRIPKTYGAETYFIDSVRADANGRFSISAEVPDQNLHVFASAFHHYGGGELTMRSNVRRGINQKVNLDLIPYAWIRMHISSTGSYNRMSINSIVGSSRHYQFRAGSDTSLISAPVLGNRAVEINMFKYKWDLQETEQVWVQTIGHDTVDVYLSF
ncbi:MAG: hypothetical protein NXI09_08855 [Bacteroidetes bacterium]|nr:hypothetical protein [Bacteroidota bacterium]